MTVKTSMAGRKIKSASIQAVKIRADGTRVPLGTIAYADRNPLKVLWWKFKRLIGVPT